MNPSIPLYSINTEGLGRDVNVILIMSCKQVMHVCTYRSVKKNTTNYINLSVLIANVRT